MSALLRQLLADTPAGLWPLDETSGATAKDCSGNGRDLTYQAAPTLRGATPVPGVATASFNGTSQYASRAMTGLSGLTAFSIEAWSMPTGRNGSPYIEFVIGSENGAANAGCIELRWGYGGLAANTGKPDFVAANGTAFIEAQSTTVYPTGERHHLCGTCDGTTCRLYVDGVQVATAAWSGSASFNSAGTGAFTVAAQKNDAAGAARFHPGGVGYGAIYTTALSADRVVAHYRAGLRMGVKY